MYKVGDKILYQNKPYYIKKICRCSLCKHREGGFSILLSRKREDLPRLSVSPLSIKPFIAVGEQLLFNFMLSKPA